MMLATTVMARVILKELVTFIKIFAIVIGLLGTFLVIQPEGIFSTDDHSNMFVRNLTRNNTEALHVTKASLNRSDLGTTLGTGVGQKRSGSFNIEHLYGYALATGKMACCDVSIIHVL